LSQEGHSVDYWIKDNKNIYKGLLKQVSDWNVGLNKDTVILFDTVGFGAVADSLKGTGHIVYGAGRLNDSLELNREFGMKIALSNSIKAQDNIEGEEMSVGAFYHEGKLIHNTLHSAIECERLMNDEKGPKVGCMGSVVRFWKNDSPKIYRLTLAKVERFLKQFKYSGILKCNCIISSKDKMPYFLGWVTHIGYTPLYEGVGKLSELNGHKPSYDWIGTVKVSMPPFPYRINACPDIPLKLIDSKHVWLHDVKMESDNLVTAGADGYICEVTGKSKSLGILEKEIYSLVEQMEIPDIQYRTDIFKSAQKKYKKLREWKYL
jgi:phosphoribosylamine-glycine ligase